jgi:hypothetical protein
VIRARVVVAAMSLAIVAGLSPRPVVAFQETVNVAAASVNLYLEPNASTKVWGTAPRGSQLRVLQSSGEWYRVSDPRTGYAVYVRKSDLEPKPLSSVPASGVPLPVAAPDAAREPRLGAGLTVGHDAPGCIVAGKFPILDARLAPADRVARARAYFHAGDDSNWYYVDMRREADVFRGTLPAPLETTTVIRYYIEAMDRDMGDVRTQEFSPIVAGAGECSKKGLVALPFLAKAVVNIGGTVAGAPVPGFASAGLAGASASGGAAAAGAASGTGAGAGGGLGGTALAGIGAGVAAVAAGVFVAAQDEEDPLTGRWSGTLQQSEANGQCTANWNLEMDLSDTGGPVTGSVVRIGTGSTFGIYQCGNNTMTGAMTSGTRNGDSVSLPFVFTGTAPGGITYSFTWTFNGKVSSDGRSMGGTLTGGNSGAPANDSGPWRASKQ